MGVGIQFEGVPPPTGIQIPSEASLSSLLERVPKAGEGKAGASTLSNSQELSSVACERDFPHTMRQQCELEAGSGDPSPGLSATLSHKGRGTRSVPVLDFGQMIHWLRFFKGLSQ